MEVRVKERGRKRKKRNAGETKIREEEGERRNWKQLCEELSVSILLFLLSFSYFSFALFILYFLLHIFPFSLFLLLLLFFLFIFFFFSLPFRSFSFSPFLFIYSTFSSCPPFNDGKLNLSFESLQIIQSYKDSDCFEYYLKSDFFLIMKNLESFECSKALNI